eukprot:s2753_g1.t1
MKSPFQRDILTAPFPAELFRLLVSHLPRQRRGFARRADRLILMQGDVVDGIFIGHLLDGWISLVGSHLGSLVSSNVAGWENPL